MSTFFTRYPGMNSIDQSCTAQIFFIIKTACTFQCFLFCTMFIRPANQTRFHQWSVIIWLVRSFEKPRCMRPEVPFLCFFFVGSLVFNLRFEILPNHRFFSNSAKNPVNTHRCQVWIDLIPLPTFIVKFLQDKKKYRKRRAKISADISARLFRVTCNKVSGILVHKNWIVDVKSWT